MSTLSYERREQLVRAAHAQRNAAVWNVVAAPELSLTLKTWCFPIVGCVGYRGYFDLDFLIDQDSGDVYLGELNPRVCGASPMTNHAAFAYADELTTTEPSSAEFTT